MSFIILATGTEVGHYQIIDKIGAGGMGEVYLAVDTKLNRKVALKFLPPHLCQDEDCRKRFTREAQAAAALDHPNIVKIYDLGGRLEGEIPLQHSNHHNTHISTRSCTGLVHVKLYINFM